MAWQKGIWSSGPEISMFLKKFMMNAIVHTVMRSKVLVTFRLEIYGKNCMSQGEMYWNMKIAFLSLI